jgi:hypothetical protein
LSLVAAHFPRYGWPVEDGGAFRRKDKPDAGESEWLPADEPEREGNGPEPEAATEPAKADERAGKAGQGKQATPKADKPAAKPKTDGKPKEVARAKAEPDTKAKPTPDAKAMAKGADQPKAKAKPRDKAKQQAKAKPQAKAKEATEAQDAKPKGPERRRQREEQGRTPTDVDAMGQEKHRKVIGQHKPNRAKSLLYYAIFVALVIALYIGASAAVSHFDKAPAHDPAKAPWAQQGAPQIPLGGFEPNHSNQRGPTHFQ